MTIIRQAAALLIGALSVAGLYLIFRFIIAWTTPDSLRAYRAVRKGTQS
jgi:hypothetical protein